MRTIVPARKRVNPWRIARLAGITVMALLGVALLGAWPWWHLLTVTDWSGGGSGTDYLATAIAAVQVVALVFVLPGMVDDACSAVHRWWCRHEAAWDEVDDR